MSCLCIGGVCIPYSALLPALLIVLRWIAAKFAAVGLLPDFIARRLGLNTAGKKLKVESDCDAGCCGGGGKKVAAKTAGRSESVATTATSDSDNEKGEVEHVDNLERWEEIFTASKNSTLFVKFTADWCKPCKAIQPAYVSLASKYSDEGRFVTLDIDGDDCDVVSSKMRVAMMPTFVCFRGGTEAGRMSGGNSEDRLGDWVGEMCA